MKRLCVLSLLLSMACASLAADCSSGRRYCCASDNSFTDCAAASVPPQNCAAGTVCVGGTGACTNDNPCNWPSAPSPAPVPPVCSRTEIPYGLGNDPEGGYRYQLLVSGAIVPSNWFQENFDDSAWPNGATPFGANLGCSQLSSFSPVATNWPIGTQLVTRHRWDIALLTGYQATLRVIVDNDLLAVYVNGNNILAAPLSRGGCPGVSSEVVLVVPTALLHLGSNVVAVHANDLGSQSFFNLQLTTSVPCDPCNGSERYCCDTGSSFIDCATPSPAPNRNPCAAGTVCSGDGGDQCTNNNPCNWP